MAIVYIGVGSNLGNREEHCCKALDLLPSEGVVVRRCSSLYETEPWGVADQPRFLNMVLEAETSLGPAGLLAALKRIEERIGRKETFRWGPRVIDLDILLYNGLVVEEPDLIIPHPHMHERDFVLRPLAEISPDLVHPVLKKTMQELLDEFAGRDERGKDL